MHNTLDEWSNWRGRIVRYKHYTYKPEGDIVPIDYVVVGGNAANYIRKHAGLKDKQDYLVLVPITRDTDEDSYELVKREDIVIIS